MIFLNVPNATNWKVKKNHPQQCYVCGKKNFTFRKIVRSVRYCCENWKSCAASYVESASDFWHWGRYWTNLRLISMRSICAFSQQYDQCEIGQCPSQLEAHACTLTKTNLVCWSVRQSSKTPFLLCAEWQHNRHSSRTGTSKCNFPVPLCQSYPFEHFLQIMNLRDFFQVFWTCHGFMRLQTQLTIVCSMMSFLFMLISGSAYIVHLTLIERVTDRLTHLRNMSVSYHAWN